MSNSRFLTLVLDDAIDRHLDYAIPDNLLGKIHPGMRVTAPLRSRTVKGTVIEIKTQADFPKTLPIHGLLDEEGAIAPDLFQLADWMSRYYATPLRRVLQTILPSSVRGKSHYRTQQLVKRTRSPKELIALCGELQRKSPSQAAVLEALIPKPEGLLLTQLLEMTKVSKSPIDALVKKGLLTIEEVRIDRTLSDEFEFFPTKPKKLNPEQEEALTKITQSFGGFTTHLIHGITGSGKTEIYLQAIDAALAQKLSVILLVPEIALTAQTIERLKGRFQEKIAILHHRLSQGERHDTWQAIHQGEIPIVVGARSALFSPLPNLGMIIVDEEQENSYKQTDEMPCYNARDVAIMRCKFAGAVCVLGSATPSLESYHNALTGKYVLTTLSHRASEANLPKVRLVDQALQAEKGNSLLSDQLLNAIEKRFTCGEQSLLFLNRRGYHTFSLCTACQKSIKCPQCDISLTFHKGPNCLSCHLCDHTLSPPPQECPACHAQQTMQFRGAGTEQVERVLHAIFPQIRTLRMDADTTRHKGSHDQLFKQFRSGKADVLIGTQMIAKGLHFPSVTLVGVLNVDGALNIPDFRASENVFQLLTQVAGRSGRGLLPGEVIIQTRLMGHPVIELASHEDYLSFYKMEIETRKEFDYPPFIRLARFVISGSDAEKTYGYGRELQAFLAQSLSSKYFIMPITPCGHAKIKNRLRFHFLIKGPHFMNLHSLALPKTLDDIRLQIDIDPLTTFL